jgi:zinc protease
MFPRVIKNLVFAYLATVSIPVNAVVDVDTLDNGLTVVIAPREGPSVVAVWVFYRWGAADEPRGLEGIAHLVEHLTFRGSPSFGPGEIDNLVYQAGGWDNAYTWQDVTAYSAVVPASHLDLALRIEAERMGSCTMDSGVVERERTVVLSELEGSAGDPDARISDAITLAAYQAHPYRVPTIGWRQDIEQSPREEIAAFYHQGYVPSNAVLVIAGGFDPENARQLIDSRFSSLPDVPRPIVRRVPEPIPRGEKRVTVRGVGANRILVVSHLFPAFGSGDFLAAQLAEAVLTGADGTNDYSDYFGGEIEPGSRLFEPLVASGMVMDNWSAAFGARDPMYADIYLVLGEETDAIAVESTLVAEVERFCADGPTAEELIRAKRAFRLHATFETESAVSWGHRLGYALALDTPDAMDGFLHAVDTISIEEVAAAARRYYDENRRMVGWFIPDPDAVGEVTESRHVGHGPTTTGERTLLPPEEQAPGMPDIHRFKLANGMRLAVVPRAGTGTFDLHLRTVHGWADDPVGRSGVADVLIGSLLAGTKNLDEVELSSAFDSLGAMVDVEVGAHSLQLSVRGVSGSLEPVLRLVANVWVEPALHSDRVTSARDAAISDLRDAKSNPMWAAYLTMLNLLYPEDHPYRPGGFGTETDLLSLSTADVVDYHRSSVRPEASVLVVVGDVETSDVRRIAGIVFGVWVGCGPALERREYDAPRPEPVDTFVVLPDREQCDLSLGVLGPSRDDPDYWACRLLNEVFAGFGMGGRVSDDIRDRQGLAYYAAGYFPSRIGPAPWEFYAGVSPANVKAATIRFDSLFDELLSSPATEWEIARAMNSLIGSSVVSLETDAALASFVADLIQFDRPDDFLSRRREVLRLLEIEDLRRVAKKYFSTGPTVRVTAGPRVH